MLSLKQLTTAMEQQPERINGEQPISVMGAPHELTNGELLITQTVPPHAPLTFKKASS